MKKYFAALMLAFLLVSCGGYNETITQKADKSFLKFVGATTEVTVTIDGTNTFTLDPKIEVYQITPGKHRVTIYRNNQLVVDRNLIVDNQATMEVQIP
jgi:outer membrane usher protein FimD/PapC